MSRNMLHSLSSIGRKRIMVIGDLMIDRYIFGSCGRISPEAPVPVLLYSQEREVLGGAANMAANIRAAGQEVLLLSCIGSDADGEKLCSLLEENGISSNLLLRGEGQVTTVKTRYVAEGQHQILRLDQEKIHDLTVSQCAQLEGKLQSVIDTLDLIVLSDYQKGVLTPEVIQMVVAAAAEHGVRIVADVKDKRPEKYRGIFLLKPNMKELAGLTGMTVESQEEVASAAQNLRRTCGSAYILVTQSGDGMTLVGEKAIHIPCEAKEVFDVTGAGDTALAYLSAALANDIPVEESALLSNIAAGVKVSKMGTSVVRLSEIRQFLMRKNSDEKKICQAEELAGRLRDLPGRKVFTNGCFDILHTGHLSYLRAAAALGDVLVVGVNSDESVRRLKGDQRPIIPASERMELLAALEFVGYVVEFAEDTPLELIERIRPDVIVKGGDYTPEQVVGKQEVESWGGEVKILPFVPGKSTSGIVKQIQEGSMG